MATKYLQYDSAGNIIEAEATERSYGIEDYGKIPQLGPDGRLDVMMMSKDVLVSFEPVVAYIGVYGNTEPGRDLRLYSTTNPTKGKIYLGSSSAYDEANIRLGIGTTIPNNTIQVLDLIRFDNDYYGTFLGYQAGALSVAAVYNTFVGYQAGPATVGGGSNTGIGYQALYSNVSGTNNTALGVRALYKNLGADGNVGLGFNALRETTNGYYNVAVGVNAMYENVSGYYNVAIGPGALSLSTTSCNNVAIGLNAGRSITGGGSNTFLGYSCGFHGSQKEDAVNSMALGNGAYTTADNQVVIGNSSITSNLMYGTLIISAVAGSSVAGGDLTLYSTTNGTKDRIFFGSSSVYDEANVRLGIGITSPSYELHIEKSASVAALIQSTGGGGNAALALYGSNLSLLYMGDTGAGSNLKYHEVMSDEGNLYFKSLNDNFTTKYDLISFNTAGHCTIPQALFNPGHYGSAASGGNLYFYSTSHSTRGSIYFEGESYFVKAASGANVLVITSGSDYAQAAIIGSNIALLDMRDTGAGANLKNFRVLVDGGFLFLRALNDDFTLKATPFYIDTSSICYCTKGLVIGESGAGVDYTLTFDGETNNGILYWMEDEDYFNFLDDIMIPAGEIIYFRDTAIKIESLADGYLDLTADTAIRLNSDTYFVGEGLGLPYGSCYGNEIAWAQASMVQDTVYLISDTDVADGELNLVTHDGSGKLTVTIAGRYLINWAISAELNAVNKHIILGIAINGAEAAPGRQHHETHGANEQWTSAGTAIIDLAATNTVEIYVKCTDAGTPNILVDHINLTVVQVGGT